MTNKDENVEQDLTNILDSVAQSANLRNYYVIVNKNESQGEGFLSEFFTGEVINKDNGKRIQVAIKRALPGDSTVFENEVIYKNEMTFYSVVFPELDKFQRKKGIKYPFNHIPKYFAGSANSKNMFIAMENLKTAGYVLFDKKKYFDSKHLEFIFKIYGKYHALSFTFKQKNGKVYESLMENITMVFEKFDEAGELVDIMQKAYLYAMDTFDPVNEADILTKLRRVQDVKSTMKNIGTYKGNYKCITHGDCWSNNMLFKYKESGELEDLRIIDFQSLGSSTPVQDLSYFFYSGASKEDLDKLDYYLDIYYQSFSNFVTELGENKEEIFPMDALKQDWKDYAVFGILAGCQIWLIKLMDKAEIEEVLNQRELPPEKYWDLWSEKIEEVGKGDVFRERTRNICLHAVEYGVL